MVNLAVIKLKDVSKIITRFCIAILIILFLLHFIKKVNFVNFWIDNIKKINQNYAKLIYINTGIVKKEKENVDLEMFILEKEIQNVKQEENTNIQNIPTTSEKIDVATEEKIENNTQENTQENKVEITIVEENNIAENFNCTYNTVKIKNESKYTLTEEILKPDIQLTNKKDIVIYHTHTCESYTPTELNTYTPSGTFRTLDLNYSVSRVGTELSNRLLNYGYQVVHNTEYHDYPAYSGSYTRSLKTINSILSNKPMQIIFDLHRDAVGSKSNYAPKIKVGDSYAAQIMFVIGTDGGSLEHSNWEQNLKFAIKVQEKANELYPGLFRPIIVRNSRYNQHVSTAASIIEVGATGNTLEECINSMDFLSQIINEVLNGS